MLGFDVKSMDRGKQLMPDKYPQSMGRVPTSQLSWQRNAQRYCNIYSQKESKLAASKSWKSNILPDTVFADPQLDYRHI
jgi:hypothetical protein